MPSRIVVLVQTLTLVVLLLGAGVVVSGQATVSSNGFTDTRATVIVDGRRLFQVAGVSARPASERARTYAANIRALASDPTYEHGSLTTEDFGDRTEIRAGARVIAMIFDPDAALESVPRGPMALAIAGRIDEAVQQYRAERTADFLRMRAGVAAGLTLVLVAWLWATRRLFGFFSGRIERRYRARLEELRDAASPFVSVDRFWTSLEGSIIAVWSLLALLSVLTYAEVVLELFPWTRRIALILADLVFGSIWSMVTGLIASVPNLVFLAVLAVVVRYVLRTLQVGFTGLATSELRISGFEPEWALPTYMIVRTIVVAFALVVAFPYIPGSSSDAFKGISIFFGVLVSLGSSSLVGNALAGSMLLYRRAFRLGDRVRIGNVVGDVMQMKLQVTHLKTIHNEEVVVPNSTILNAEIVNYDTFARRGELILRTSVGIGYETPWRQVEAMLCLAASRTEGLLKSPPPFVWQTALGDYAVTYELHVYTDDAHRMAALYSELHRQILDVFNEYDVQIMTPSYEQDPEQPKVVPRDQWYLAPARPEAAGKPARTEGTSDQKGNAE